MTTHLLAAATIALVSSLGLSAMLSGSAVSSVPASRVNQDEVAISSEVTPHDVAQAVAQASSQDAAAIIVQGVAQEIPQAIPQGVDTWRSSVVSAIPDAAATCGVVSIKNAPATIVVTFAPGGEVSSATSESSLFGGSDTDTCLRGQLAGLSRLGAPAVITSVRHVLVESVVR